MQPITRTLRLDAAALMRGQWLDFRRRSLWQPAVAAGLVTYGLQRTMPVSLVGIGARALAIFALFSALVLLTQWLAAQWLSASLPPFTLTFSERALTVHEGEKKTASTWRWLLAAEETPTEFVLWSRRGVQGRLALFLPKASLDEAECRTLRGWLAAHGKLPEPH